jgi:hypothetical protein
LSILSPFLSPRFSLSLSSLVVVVVVVHQN